MIDHCATCLPLCLLHPAHPPSMQGDGAIEFLRIGRPREGQQGASALRTCPNALIERLPLNHSRSVGMGLPTALLTRVGVEGPTQQIAISLPFEEKSIGSVRYFKLYPIAPDEAL